MAREVGYKQYGRRDRRAVIEDDLSKGMMSTDGALDEGYVKYFVNCSYEKETHAITPRPGLRLCDVIFPVNPGEAGVDFLWNVYIKASKQCVEDGVTYSQFILCKTDPENPLKGKLWVLTAPSADELFKFDVDEDYSIDTSFRTYYLSGPYVCYLYTADNSAIHDVRFEDDSYKRIQFPVGTFAYGNSFYFIGESSLGAKGLFKTTFDTSVTPSKYVVEMVEPKTPTVSEAVTYGYNMLKALPYQFSNNHTGPSSIQFDGILPYEIGTSPRRTKLMMTPKKNQPVDLVCYYTLDTSTHPVYDIIWESRETTASDWTQLKKEEHVTFDDNTTLTLDNFIAQDKEIMVRVSAYTVGSDTIEKAIVVGFDFTVESYGTAKSLEQKNYDLTTATGMESWKGRVVLWGLPEDPTIVFISDYQEPSYFPYPNNIVVFDEPVIYCIEFMDTLAVFTTDKLYQVSLADDGSSWNTVLLQSHLSIDVWDKHLIQTVRNMLYFKSGNYYYMMVPKAQSTTGELTMAPITTPITTFFDRFSVNVQTILKQTYGDTTAYDLITYYNFLDYDDIHNIYAFKLNNYSESILHFDVIYNTVDRTWKVWLYELESLIFPFKQEATRYGTFAISFPLNFDIVSTYVPIAERVVQLLCWDKMLLKSYNLPLMDKEGHMNSSILYYDEDTPMTEITDHVLHIGDYLSEYVEPGTLYFYNKSYARIKDHVLQLQNDADLYNGYSMRNINDIISDVLDNQDNFYSFRNYQFIDSGYRNDSLHYKKRYREVQFQINNLDKKDMNFGMDYILDGSPRGIYYKYDVAQSIDEMDPDYGIVYIDTTPYMDTELDSIDLTNQWTLDQHLIPEVTLWKIRVAISGKGYAPRLRLYSRNEKRFELYNIAWVSKVMHMR